MKCEKFKNEKYANCRTAFLPNFVMMSLLRSFLFVMVFCCIGLAASAQFETVYVGVNGLTCSQCSRTVEMSIRKLDFVADVQMNLQHTEGKIILKKNKKADMDRLAQAVFDAGFSVRFLRADLLIDNSVNVSGSCFTYRGDGYIFTQAPKAPLKGTVTLTFIGKKFMPKNDLKKIPVAADDKCGNVTGKVYRVMM